MNAGDRSDAWRKIAEIDAQDDLDPLSGAGMLKELLHVGREEVLDLAEQARACTPEVPTALLRRLFASYRDLAEGIIEGDAEAVIAAVASFDEAVSWLSSGQPSEIDDLAPYLGIFGGRNRRQGAKLVASALLLAEIDEMLSGE